MRVGLEQPRERGRWLLRAQVPRSPLPRLLGGGKGEGARYILADEVRMVNSQSEYGWAEEKDKEYSVL